jgi:aminocarboxymuconate-semialdehyde decarboxylase
MDSLGVDMHVVSPYVGFYNYHLDTRLAIATSRAVNDEISEMARARPARFAGLGTVPMQDVTAAVAELERCMTQLGLKGVEINDHVNGRTLEEPEFRPFWKAAEALGALVFFHQASETLVTPRTTRYHLPNSIGNLVDRAVTFATLVHGGVMDAFPGLKVCLGHGGGYTCFGIGRMDHGWQVRAEARQHITQPPTAYLRRFYYDCIVYTEPALRYLIDTVGADRVVFGTDWPYDMALDWPVAWILGMKSLTQEEKEAILWRNLEGLLALPPASPRGTGS